jgi:hypothetical protein
MGGGGLLEVGSAVPGLEIVMVVILAEMWGYATK